MILYVPREGLPSPFVPRPIIRLGVPYSECAGWVFPSNHLSNAEAIRVADLLWRHDPRRYQQLQIGRPS